jgi:hypothetical protein
LGYNFCNSSSINFSIVLTLLGAKVAGYSLKPKQKLSFFNLANLKKEIYLSLTSAC